MRTDELIFKEDPTRIEKAEVIVYYTWRTQLINLNLIPGQWSDDELDHAYQKAKEYFTENIDMI